MNIEIYSYIFQLILGTVILSKNNSTKKKCITVISGLEDFYIKLKDILLKSYLITKFFL